MGFSTRLIFILLISMSLLLVSGLSGCQQEAQPEIGSKPSQEKAMGETLSGKMHEVAITSQGFSPNPLSINAGDAVRWTNEDSKEHWPASAMHPTHKVYPGSDIQKCGTDQQGETFDACKGLAQGESFSFTFSEKGEWKYHDHLNVASPFFGSITVN